MKIPSTVAEYQVLGVLHVGVDLTVFEESVRVKDVRVRIHRFVAEHRPFDPQPVVKRSPQNQVTYHMLSRIIAPAGMNCPSYTSSSINRCGIPEAGPI